MLFRIAKVTRIHLLKNHKIKFMQCKELEECGYNYNGTETMMCGGMVKLRAESSLDQYITTD